MSSASQGAQRINALRPVSSRKFRRELIDSIIALRLTYSDWIVRRVDRVTFLDTETTQKESEFHLIIPRDLPTIQLDKEEVHLLPLVTFERNVPLRSLRVTDESGTVLSSLTKEEHRMVMEQMFESLQQDAAIKLKAKELNQIFNPKPDRGPSLSVPKVSGGDVSNWWSEELEEFLEATIPSEEIALRTFVIDLWLGYVHLVAVPKTDHGVEGNRRRVITLSHEERVVTHEEPPERTESPSISNVSELEGEFGGGLRHLRRVLGLTEHRKKFRIGRFEFQPLEWFRSWLEPQWVRILWAKWYDDEYGSCHTELNVPPELEVRQAFLYKRHYGEDTVTGPQHGRDRHFSGAWDLYTSAYTGSSAHLLEMGALNGWSLVDPEAREASLKDDREGRWGKLGPGRGIRSVVEWLKGLSIRGQRSDSFLLENEVLEEKASGLLSRPKATERGMVAIVSIVLSARSSGLRRSGLVVGAFSLAMLLLAGLLVWLTHNKVIGSATPNLEVLATVLVFAPTVAAAVISQRASHPMTQELTGRLRDAVVVFGVLPVVAVIVLALTDGLGPYDLLSPSMSGGLLGVFVLLDIFFLWVLFIQHRIEKKIEPEPLPRSAYWHPADPRTGETGESRALRVDSDAKALVQTSLQAQPARTKVVQSVEGLRLPVASFFFVGSPSGKRGTLPSPRHSWLTDGALRRAARRFADSAGIDLT